MPMRSAVRRCPQGIIVRPRFSRYKEVSGMVMELFHEVTDLVEPLSLDEAYLDITSQVESGLPPLAVALDLKRRVNEVTGLTLSVGVGANKSVAKIASDLYKPDGLVVVPPGEEAEFLAPLSVGKLWGIGPKTAERLRQEGVDTIGQLADQPMDWFNRCFGVRAFSVRAKARGEDREPVHTGRETKSVSAETTFAADLGEPERLHAELARLAGNVSRHLERKGLQGRTVTMKARLANFTTFTRQVTLPAPTGSEQTILDSSWRLLAQELEPGRTFRLLGVGVASFQEEYQLELPLYEDETEYNREKPG
jgi:DNA polymerase-4